MSKEGFTLIEVMVSLAILAIILVVLAHTAVVTIRNNAYFEHRKIALELAQNTINSLISLPYTSPSLSDLASDTTFLNNPTPDPDNNGNVYLLDNDGNGNYSSSSDINDSGDANNGIDHPSNSISDSYYSSIAPIEIVTPVTYYKVWGIEDVSNPTDMKRIVVLVYWFESNSTRPHSVSLTTYMRRP